MKVGILGGTFDPIHFGHISIGLNALRDLSLDKILVLVAGKSAHKDRKMSNMWDRYNMANLMVSDYDKFEVSDYEIKKDSKSYSYLTMKDFKEAYSCDIYFIAGSDSLLNIESWYRWEDFLSLVTFLIYARPNEDNYEARKKAKELNDKGFKIIFKEGDFLNISSTDIRKRVKNKESIEGLTSNKVIKYIKDKELYLD